MIQDLEKEAIRDLKTSLIILTRNKKGFIGSILLTYSILGQIIYGGFYWRKLKYWQEGNSAAYHLWLISLLQWVLGLIFPLIAPLIINCMLIYSTRSSNCNPNHLQFPPLIQQLIQYRYEQFPSQYYFTQRCSKPRLFFISFLVCQIIGVFLVAPIRASIKNSVDDDYNKLFKSSNQIVL